MLPCFRIILAFCFYFATMKWFFIIGLLFFLWMMNIRNSDAQQVILATGSDAVGDNGSVTWSVGQTAFSSMVNSDLSILEGIQQPFEFQYNTGIDDPRISVKYQAFPNPTDGIIILCIDYATLEGFRYELRDMQSKVLAAECIQQKETSITVEKSSSSVSLLTIFLDNRPVQTIRIIKR